MAADDLEALKLAEAVLGLRAILLTASDPMNPFAPHVDGWVSGRSAERLGATPLRDFDWLALADWVINALDFTGQFVTAAIGAALDVILN